MVEKLTSKGGYADSELKKTYQTVRQGRYTIIMEENELVFQQKETSFAIPYAEIDSYYIRKAMIITKLKSGKVITFWLERSGGHKKSVSTKKAKKFVKALDHIVT